MGHRLQVVRCDRVDGVSGEMRAKCSCDAWSKDDPKWTYPRDGHDVYDAAWADFRVHVEEALPGAVVCYHVIGWYPNIPRNERRSSNLSDGVIFSTMELAEAHVKKHGISVLSLDPIMLASDDPQIDHTLRPFWG